MKKHAGLTLIELMVALSIVVLLTAVAVPAYTNFVKKSSRSDAMATLMRLQLEQAKYRSKNLSYALSLGSVSISTSSINGKYTIAMKSATAGSFTATATPAGTQQGDDCGVYTINQSGPDVSGTYKDSDGNYADDGCWKR